MYGKVTSSSGAQANEFTFAGEQSDASTGSSTWARATTTPPPDASSPATPWPRSPAGGTTPSPTPQPTRSTSPTQAVSRWCGASTIMPGGTMLTARSGRTKPLAGTIPTAAPGGSTTPPRWVAAPVVVAFELWNPVGYGGELFAITQPGSPSPEPERYLPDPRTHNLPGGYDQGGSCAVTIERRTCALGAPGPGIPGAIFATFGYVTSCLITVTCTPVVTYPPDRIPYPTPRPTQTPFGGTPTPTRAR